MATLTNRDGSKLFGSDDPAIVRAKWDSAVVACRQAIDICHAANIRLYKYQTIRVLSDTLMLQLTLRNTFTEKWNSEIIWANTQTDKGIIRLLQELSSPTLDPRWPDNAMMRMQMQPPIKIAEMYYTDNGVPIEEDTEWQTLDPLALRTGTDAEKYYIKNGYTTVQLHFDREPRFYAWLGFDGGIWYGQRIYGNNPDELFYVSCRVGGAHAKKGAEWGPVTGYYWKKCVHFENVQPSMLEYSSVYYPWPVMRLSDLYLLYAEAINEAEGPNGTNSSELFKYIDLVRDKAGLKGVKYSWDNYTGNKKYQNQIGMREIIHHERLIELSFEAQRFWDIRRWQKIHIEYEKNIEGYKISERNPEDFYQRIVLFQQPFSIKDYFWPIQISVIENNPNIVQNIGW
jgi:hypothetical protein